MAQRAFSSRSDKERAEVREVAVDSNILLGAFLEGDRHHSEATAYVEKLETRESLFHVSTLVPVEVCGAILRRTKSPVRAFLAKGMVESWIEKGNVKLYPLDRERMVRAEEIALRTNLKGHDAVIAEVAEESGLELLTFDKEVLEHFKQT